MKRIIEMTFLLLLICFSFFYTDKVMNLINKNTPLMKEINSVKDEYEILPVSAIISDDTIIPGVKGREIDILKSYEEMKIGGIFREEALIYKDLYPSSSLLDNQDKYIIKGNSLKNEVSLLVIVDKKNLDKVINISNITLFVNHSLLTIDNINKLKDKEIYTYGKNGFYSDEILTSDNFLINRTAKNDSLYCLSKEKKQSILDKCNDNKMFVVIPNIIGDYLEIKNNLSGGSIILLDNLKNIDVIIKYINSKGYEIVGLSELLRE